MFKRLKQYTLVNNFWVYVDFISQKWVIPNNPLNYIFKCKMKTAKSKYTNITN